MITSGIFSRSEIRRKYKKLSYQNCRKWHKVVGIVGNVKIPRPWICMMKCMLLLWLWFYTLSSVTRNGHVKYKSNSLVCKIHENSTLNKILVKVTQMIGQSWSEFTGQWPVWVLPSVVMYYTWWTHFPNIWHVFYMASHHVTFTWHACQLLKTCQVVI